MTVKAEGGGRVLYEADEKGSLRIMAIADDGKQFVGYEFDSSFSVNGRGIYEYSKRCEVIARFE